MKWRPTPESRRIVARRLDGDRWVDTPMKDLHPGDIFRCVFPDGTVIHPCTHEPDDVVVCKVTDLPIKNINNQIGSIMGAEGYGVPIELYESMDDLNKRGLS